MPVRDPVIHFLMKKLGNPGEKVGEVETPLIELRGDRASIEETKVVDKEVITEYPELPYRPVGHIEASKPRRAVATPSFTKFWFDKKRRCNIKRVEIEGVPPYFEITCEE